MKPIHPKSKQQGAALVVGLIVLLIMTLLGVSSMGSATLELKMANNLQTHNYAFQAAQSTAALITDSASANTQIQALDWASTGPQTVNTITASNVHSGSLVTGTVNQTAVISYQGCLNVPEGYEISGGDQYGGSSSLKALVQEIDATASVASVTGTVIGEARVVQGYYKGVRPGCPNT